MSLLDELSVEFRVGRKDLEKFVRRAPIRYRVFEIDKRGGGKRTIAQPSATLKALQRYLVTTRINKLPIHRSAMAYVSGSSIAKNAEVHASGRFILKLDFKSFFPSITVMAWRKLARSNGDIIDPADMGTLEKLLFWGVGSVTPRCLSIGAPSSPAISNAVMFSFDTLVSDYTKQLGVSYTRYADDITLSSNSTKALVSAESHITSITRRQRVPLLILNDVKRGLYGPGQRRLVTGLVVTPESIVSLGRERKRLISAMIHRATMGDLDVEQLSKLKGLLAFALDADPMFVRSMERKYGEAAILTIRRFYAPPRSA